MLTLSRKVQHEKTFLHDDDPASPSETAPPTLTLVTYTPSVAREFRHDGSLEAFLAGEPVGDVNVTERDLRMISANVLQQLVAVNAADPVLFRQGGVLVRINRADHGAPKLQPVSQDLMRHILARRLTWFKQTGKGEVVGVFPPLEVVRDLLALPSAEFPVVERIVSVPVFSAHGTIQTTPGYNTATRTIFLPTDHTRLVLPVATNPDKDEIAAAVDLFNELVHDFPFVGSGKTHALAALLTPFARNLIHGPTPLHLIEKPSAGTGATLLAQVICDISVGHPVAAMTEARNEDEFGRKIHSKLCDGPAVILLDNLRNHLNSGALAAALTADVFEDRVVQSSQIAAAPVRCLWLATANNPSLSKEMVRRTVPIRMDAKMTDPHLRTGFRHPNLRDWVAAEHSTLVWALLTMIQAWIAAGRPKGTRTLGMYESYSEVIGGILQVAGVAGFLETAGELSELEDEGDEELRPLIPLWWSRFKSQPVGVKDLLPLYTGQEHYLSADLSNSTRIKLGQLLRANRDRHFGDVVLTAASKKAGSMMWMLVPVVGSGA